ncbi:MAG: hypothetical protein A2Y56_06330 [Candidatus Aminicenantes bacterium RBG_13_63_10]|nr:MAG: hypothetical protein A2Y56_06330 [Candidatus Aminicenantes bacterium RBG_13_63_10]
MDNEKDIEVVLIGLSEIYKDNTYKLVKDEFLVGRARDCDLRMDENTISGHHAKILKVQDHYEVEDLQSTNGTFLNGLRVAPRSRLRSGDKLKFDQYEFQFIDPSDVSRTLVAPRAALAEAQKTAVRPAPSPAPAIPLRAAPKTRAGSLAGGVLVAVLATLLIGLGGNVLLRQATIAGSGGALLDSAWDNTVNLAQSYPVMHQAHLWAEADLGRWQNIVSILLIIVSVILGGILVQSIGRRKKIVSAIAYSVIFVLAALLFQAAALRFRLQALPLFFSGLVQGLSPWPAFGLGVLYIFGVVLVLSLVGTLLVRKNPRTPSGGTPSLI